MLKRLSEIEMSDEGEFRKVRRDRIFEKEYFDKKYGAQPEISDNFDLIEAMKGVKEQKTEHSRLKEMSAGIDRVEPFH